MNTSTKVLIFLLVLGTVLMPLHAEDVHILKNTTRTIASNEDLILITGTYWNEGTLAVNANGRLEIGSGVANGGSTTFQGLELGLVHLTGELFTGQTVRFAEGSRVTGTVLSAKDVYFKGNTTITGIANIEATTLYLTTDLTGGSTEEITVNLQSGAQLDVDTINIAGLVEFIGIGGADITLDSDFILSTKGAAASFSENLIVTGNFFSVAGTMIGCSEEKDWTLTLQGGGTAVDGWNNILAFTSISPKTLRLENKSQVVKNLGVSGNLQLGADSYTQALAGLVLSGQLHLESDALLELKGDLTGMFVYGSSSYNLVAYGGFQLDAGAILKTMDSTDSSATNNLQISISSSSSLAVGASIVADSVYILGTDSTTSLALQEIVNRGTIEGKDVLSLSAIELENTGPGVIKASTLLLLQKTTLFLTSNNDPDNGGLIITEKGGLLGIDSTSSIVAVGKTIDFGGAAVLNLNTDGGISASRVVFGDGGSLAGKGTVLAHGTFQEGSTLILDNSGYVNFANFNVVLQTGATIEMNIASGVIGYLATTGAIETEENVILSIADGSNFGGRTNRFLIAQGNADSSFHENMVFADSLFFDLVDHWTTEITDDKGAVHHGLVVEILKVADLVDYAGSKNQRNLGLLIDRMIEEEKLSTQQHVIYDALMKMSSDAAYCAALDSLTGSVRENSLLYTLSSPWRAPLNSIGFHQLSLALERRHLAGDSLDDADILGQKKSLLPKWPMSKSGLSHDLWMDTFYQYDKLNSDRNTSGGEGHRGGFVLGAGLPTGNGESLIGLSFGYAGGQFVQTGDKVEVNDYRIGLYAGSNLLRRNLQIRGYVGYGFQDYKMDRTVQFGTLNPYRTNASTDGTSISAAVYFVRPVDMSDYWLLKPTIGFDFERLEQDGFSESGSETTRWDYADASMTRSMFRVGFTSDHTFRNSELTGRFLYGVNLTGKNAVSSRHFVQGSKADYFDVSSVDIGSSVFEVGLGGNRSLNRTRTMLLFLDYNAAFTRNSNSHAGSLGFQWKR